ncbi:MAG: hypothetical protein JRG89_12150 [Deltaproteobacteria bacterium]|nr:hypothetical protein [Deltaproteobacteria bacterium]MBW2389175.1 hypothetical protein [Deltaproteobacteria bacterium]
MNWWNRFGRSLLFAILVAGVYPIYAGFAGLLVGQKLAFAAYLLTTAAIYLLGIARHPASGIGAASATIFVGMLFLLFGASGVELLLVTCLLIGVFRSGLLHSGSPQDALGFTRRFTRELVFIGAGLALAHYMGRSTVYPEAFAMWGFYLAQSGFFLLGGDAARERVQQVATAGPDAFAQALKRARDVLAMNP